MTHSRTCHGGSCLTCCACPHSRSAIQSPNSSCRNPTMRWSMDPSRYVFDHPHKLVGSLRATSQLPHCLPGTLAPWETTSPANRPIPGIRMRIGASRPAPPSSRCRTGQAGGRRRMRPVPLCTAAEGCDSGHGRDASVDCIHHDDVATGIAVSPQRDAAQIEPPTMVTVDSTLMAVRVRRTVGRTSRGIFQRPSNSPSMPDRRSFGRKAPRLENDASIGRVNRAPAWRSGCACQSSRA